MKTVVLAAVAGLLMAPPAQAEPYMWGIGPRIGTTALPARYPSFWPAAVGTDGPFDKVGFDGIVGIQGVYYAKERVRIGGIAGFSVGVRFWDVHGLVTSDWMVYTGAADMFVGGGIGAGQQTWIGRPIDLGKVDAAGEPIEGDAGARLRIPNFPIRLHTGVQVRSKLVDVMGTLFGQYHFPANSFFTDNARTQQQVGMGFYLVMGVELSVLFGDFMPPRPAMPDPSPPVEPPPTEPPAEPTAQD